MKKTFKTIQIIVVALYGFAIIMGMIFSSAKYQAYDINIFEFADILDFLVYPFLDIKSVAYYGFLPIIIFSLFYSFDRYLLKNHPDFYSKYLTPKFFRKYLETSWYAQSQKITLLTIPLYLVINYFLYYDMHSNEPLLNLYQPMTIKMQNGETKKGFLLGKVKDVIFFINVDSILNFNDVSIIPYQESVTEIKILGKFKTKGELQKYWKNEQLYLDSLKQNYRIIKSKLDN